jgi:hypothetical protein
MYLKETGREGVVWIHMAVVGSCEHSNEPLDFITSWEYLDQLCAY